MRCPFCSNPTLEHQVECPRCGFALHKLDAMFGAIPRLSPGISDDAALFSPKDTKKLSAEVDRFEGRYPQISFNIVTTNLRAGENLAAYAFWIFNKAGICRPVDVGGENHDILLMIDAANSRASIIVGYGLEPFVGEKELAEVIGDAAPDFRESAFLEGTRAALAALERVLSRICGNLDKTYGISMDDIPRTDSAPGEVPADVEDSPY